MPLVLVDTGPTAGQTHGMTVKLGISLPDGTYARPLEYAHELETTLSGLIAAALQAELTRRDLADHVAMLADADDADRLRMRARSRTDALAA